MESKPREILKGLVARDALSLFDVVRVLMEERQTGELELRGRGRIFLERGRVVGAQAGRFSRNKALFRIWATPGTSVFRFVQHAPREDRGLSLSLTDLVYLQQQTDEYFALIKRIPLDAHLERNAEYLDGEMGRMLVKLLSVPRTVKDVLDAVEDLPDLLVLRAIGRFLAAGQVRLVQEGQVLPFRGLRFVNVAILAPREEWLEAFYEDLGLAHFARTKAQRVQYAYLELQPARFHLYGIHFAPGMGLGQIRPFLEFAHLFVAIGSVPMDLQQSNLLRQEHLHLILRTRNGWQLPDRTPVQLGPWLKAILEAMG